MEEGSSTWFINCGILWNDSGSSAFFFLLVLVGLSVVNGLFVVAGGGGGGFLPAGILPWGSSTLAPFIGGFFFFVFGAFDADVDADADDDALAFDALIDAPDAFIASASASAASFASLFFLLCALIALDRRPMVVVVVQV